MNRVPGTDRGRGSRGGNARLSGNTVGISGWTSGAYGCLSPVPRHCGCSAMRHGCASVGSIRQVSVVAELVGNTQATASS